MNSRSSEIVVIGSGGQARVVISACRAAGRFVAAVYDDDSRKWGQSLFDSPILGPVEAISTHHAGCEVIIGIGDAFARRNVAERLKLDWGTVVHPHAYVDPSVHLGPGTVVFAGSVIQPECRVGAHGIVNTGATVDHNCVLEDFVQVAPGANLCGNVMVHEGAFIGANSVILENIQVGRWSIVGAGATVNRHVPDGVVVVGCPARVLKSLEYPRDPKERDQLKDDRIRRTAETVIQRVWAESGRPVRPLTEHDTFTGSLQLDSLDLAVMVVALEEELGIDPFREGAAPVPTFGEMVKLYEQYAARTPHD